MEVTRRGLGAETAKPVKAIPQHMLDVVVLLRADE